MQSCFDDPELSLIIARRELFYIVLSAEISAEQMQ